MSLADDHALLHEVVTGPGDESSPDVLLVLWFLRHVFVVDELDAYEHVVVQDSERSVDGLYLEPAFDASEPRTLYVFEAKFGPSAEQYDAEVVEKLLASVNRLAAGGLLEEASEELRLVGLRERLDEGIALGTIHIQPVLLLDGTLSPQAQAAAEEGGVNVYALDRLAELARALATPGLLPTRLTVRSPKDRRFVTTTAIGAVAIAEVRIADIAEWPGIDDRSLFGLNVRGELGRNRVRSELDAALKSSADLENFIAYHNGITVLCQYLDTDADDEFVVQNISVVNGAQSVLAFQRNRVTIDDEARVLVKFVQVADASPEFATEVARRSNTQTAVNPRNLRANDGRQRALEAEFAGEFPLYSYVVKPDVSRVPPGIPINNDDAAQLLCALFNERPWLAVKRLELFRSPNYQLIFSPSISAAHIVFAHGIRTRIESSRNRFPDDYRRSWRLTAVMAVFLVGQVLRSNPMSAAWLENPRDAANFDPDVEHVVDDAIATVAAVLADWHQHRLAEFGYDDYKVDFKRENVARSLGKLVSQVTTTPS